MGHKIFKVKIKNEKGEREVELLIDTGSTYTWIDKKILEEIGVKKMGTRKFKSIDGKILEREIGEARIKINEREAFTIVVFAEPEDGKVLGVQALEGLMLEYDPTTGELKPSEFALAL